MHALMHAHALMHTLMRARMLGARAHADGVCRLLSDEAGLHAACRGRASTQRCNQRTCLKWPAVRLFAPDRGCPGQRLVPSVAKSLSRSP